MKHHPWIFVLLAVLVASCQMVPTFPAAGTTDLTVSWSVDSASRTLLPHFPAPVSYDVKLQPTVGEAIEKTGIATNTWSFTNLTSGTFTVTITGYDAAAKVLVTGTRSFDTSTLTNASLQVPLNYVLTGTGKGQIHLTVTVPSTLSLHETFFQLVDPAGAVTTPALAAGPNAFTFTFTNTGAAVGNYQLFFRMATGTQTALRVETLLVAQNLDTVVSVPFTVANFSATYVPVTGVTLPATASVGLKGSLPLAATFAPLAASNKLLSWTSDKPEVVTVDQTGLVTGKAFGDAVITATSVDNPAQSATCTVTVKTLPVTYDANGGTGTAPTDAGSYSAGDAVTVLGNTGSLAKTGFGFGGWNTQADGNGTLYAPGSTLTMGNSSVTLYAFWPTALQVTYYDNTSTSGTVPAVQDVLQGQSTVVADNTGALVKTGYAFTSWNTLPTGLGTVYLPGSSLTMGSTAASLYAFWNTVVYDGNGATGGVVPVDTYPHSIAAQNVEILANTGTLVKTGYRFMGWNTKADGTGTTYSSYGITITKPAGIFTLYAKWVPVYTTTYDANGATSGTVPTDTGLLITGEKVTVQANPGTLAKTNSVFSGWNTAADGSGTQYAEAALITVATSPVVLYARWVPQVASLSTNGTFTFALTPSGDLYATGQNYYGNFGDGTTASRTTFAKMMSGVKKAYARSDYYQFAYFLKDDNSVYSAGSSNYGALGTGKTSEPTVAFVINGVADLVAGDGFFLFLRGTTLFGSGVNSSGQFGRGNTTGSTTPVSLRTDVSRVWAGPSASFILTTDGRLLSAGDNAYGKLGRSGSETTYTEVTSLVATDVADIAMGTNHTLILLKNGTVWAAGYNFLGQLGLGDSTNRAAFTEVTALGSDVKAIFAFGSNSYALKNDGKLFGMGNNDGYAYALGIFKNTGDSEFFRSPVEVLSSVQSVATTTYHTLFVKTDGSLWAIGNNNYNNGSVGTTAISTTPKQVLF